MPTLKELGHNIVAMSPYGLPGTAGMPADLVQRLHQAFRAAMQDPAFVVELAPYDQEPACPPPEESGRALRAAYDHERVVVERLGLAQKGDRRLPLPAWAAESRRVATRWRTRRLGWISAFCGAAG